MTKKSFNKHASRPPAVGDALEKALTPVSLPFTDDALAKEVQAENRRRAKITAALEKGVGEVSLDEIGDYTLKMLRSLSGGKKMKPDAKIERAMEEAAALLQSVDVERAQQAEERLRGKSVQKLDDWAKSGAPTGQDIKPLRPISLKPKLP